jgi:DNA-binding transcriptional MerR regulator
MAAADRNHPVRSRGKVVSKGPDAFRTISEVAEDLDLPQHVLRFWETRFAQIKPLKRGGGRRYYRPDDIDLLRGIRHLLYGEGYTIKGVQRILREQGQRFVTSAGRGEIDGLVIAAQRSASAAAGDDDAGQDEAASVDAMDDLVEADLGEDNEDGDGDLGIVPRVDMPEPKAGSSRRLVEGLMPAVRPGANGRHDLAGDDLHRLQATLTELLECKRLLDQVR